MADRKAWLYVERDGFDYGEAHIVYARSRTRAEALVLEELGYARCERKGITVERRAEFDGFGHMRNIPDRVYYELDWPVVCRCCGRGFRKESGWKGSCEPEDGDEWTDLEPCFSTRDVFCSPKCLAAQEREWARYSGHERGLRFALAEWLPGCKLEGFSIWDAEDQLNEWQSIQLPKAFGHVSRVEVSFATPEYRMKVPAYYAARVDAYMASIGDPMRFSEPGDEAAA